MKTKSNPLENTHTQCFCGNPLTGKQTKFCSIQCKQKSTNSKHQNYVCQQNRGTKRKIELVKIYGNECSICGYKKNLAALSFHHIDPTAKKFGIDLRQCSNRKWTTLLEEVAKCQLVCLNCHAEIHNPNHCV